MGFEIERRFLVKHPDLDKYLPQVAVHSYRIEQRYFNANPVIRIRHDEKRGWTLDFKDKAHGLVRKEYSIMVSAEVGQALFDMADLRIEKTRYEYQCGSLMWEVDIFHGKNDGLIIAEVELAYENEEIHVWPLFVDRDLEITNDPVYANANLAQV